MTSHSSVLSRTVILTGGNSGLGYACARALARSDTHVSLILASRSQQAAQVVDTLKRETGNLILPWKGSLGSTLPEWKPSPLLRNRMTSKKQRNCGRQVLNSSNYNRPR